MLQRNPDAERGVAACDERVLLVRSGRHLRVAMDALATRYPGCRIGVVGTPGSEPALAQAGVAPGDMFIYRAPRIQPLAFFFSLTALAVRRWRYDRVAILWNDPEGTGQGNVDRTALAMSPRGYLAVTPDGSIVVGAGAPPGRPAGRRVVASTGVAAALGLFLYLPALLFGPVASAFRRTSGPAKAGHYGTN
jgi:hypothetical protein